MAEDFEVYIKMLVRSNPETAVEKLLVATIAQVGEKLSKSLGEYRTIKTSYSFKLDPAQAIAIALLSEDLDKTSYLGNKLHMISNIIHQQYN